MPPLAHTITPPASVEFQGSECSGKQEHRPASVEVSELQARRLLEQLERAWLELVVQLRGQAPLV